MESESLLAKLVRHSSRPDTAGHVTWSGRRGRHGAPLIRHNGRETPAAAAAFQQRTGRTPVGMSRADCGVQYCIAPDHVQDDLERRHVRLQLRSVYGWMQPWTACRDGHSWEDHGRVEPDLTLYCRACNTNRARGRRRAERKAS